MKNPGKQRELLEIKNAIVEMENSLKGLEDKAVEISQKTVQKGRTGKK